MEYGYGRDSVQSTLINMDWSLKTVNSKQDHFCLVWREATHLGDRPDRKNFINNFFFSVLLSIIK